MKKSLAVFFVLIVCSTFIFACGKEDKKEIKDLKDTKAENAAEVESDTEIESDTETESTTETEGDTETESDTKTESNTETESTTETEDDTEYWLCGTGIPDGPDYTGGICKVYFKQNTIVLDGNLLKSMSQEDYEEQIGTVETYNGEEIEVSADCKIIQDEGNEEKTYSYGEYIEIREISESDNVAGIYMAITVKNGKVIEIYYSS